MVLGKRLMLEDRPIKFNLGFIRFNAHATYMSFLPRWLRDVVKEKLTSVRRIDYAVR